MPGQTFARGCFFIMILATLLSFLLEGAFFSGADNNLVQDITRWTAGTFSWWSIPVVLASVMYHLPQIVSFDYSFLHSLGFFGAMVRLICGGTLAFGIIWGFLVTMIPIAYQMAANLGRGLISLFR